MRLKKKNKDRTFLIAAVAIAVALIAANHLALQMMHGGLPELPLLPEAPNIPLSPPSLEGYEIVEVETGPGTVSLTSNCTRLVMTTSQQQSSSIQDGLDGVVDFRPTSHDMAADILDIYWIDPLYVTVDRLEKGTYFAKLVLRSEETVTTLDARPTDAIGVAVRFGSPVYVRGELLETYGEGIC